MKNIDYEKLCFTGATAFMVGFGLINCNVADFMSGFFAGAAGMIAYLCWKD